MGNLVLELKPGEMMVINGAAIRFRSKSRIELASHARFLFGKQIMAQQDANTPARRVYYVLQTIYVGTEDERRQALAELQERIALLREATTSASLAVCRIGGTQFSDSWLESRYVELHSVQS